MPFSFRGLLSLLALAVLIPGCAKEKSYDPSGTFPIYQYENSGITIFSALRSAPFSFEGGEMPAGAESVGLIGIVAGPVSPYGFPVGQCTGWLMDRNTVATNSHCITEAVSQAPDCGAALAIKFLNKDSRGVTTYACKRLLGKSVIREGKIDQADWAFFEIAATDRIPLRVSRAGVPDGKRLRAVQVSPVGGGSLGGVLGESACKAVQGSILNIGYRQNISISGLAIGCPAIPGNSGSPVLDAVTGEALGILQSGVTRDYLEHTNKGLAPLGISFSTSPPSHFIFTNLACVPDPRTGFSGNEATCASKGDKPFIHREELRASRAEAIEKAASAWRAALPSFAVYRIASSPDSPNLHADPLCVRPLAQWPAAMLSTMLSEALNRQRTFRSTYRTAYSDAFVVESAKFEIDEEFRIEKEVKVSLNEQPGETTLSFEKELSEIRAEREFSEGGFSIGRKPLVGLGWCSPGQLAAGNQAVLAP